MNQNAKRVFSGIAGLAGSIYLSSVAFLAVRQNHLIFNPIKKREANHPHSPLHRARRIVLRSDDGTRLEGWLLRPTVPGICPMAIYFGGRSEEISWLVRDAATMFPGIAVLAVNYRGYGESHGMPGEKAIMQDGLMLYRWASNLRFVRTENIAVIGRSLGSGIALQIAAQRPVAAVVLITPYDSMLAIAKRRYPALPVSWLLRHRFESVKFAPHVSKPILIIRAESDDIVPQRHTDDLIAQFRSVPIEETIPGSDHMTIPYLPQTQERIATFLHKVFQCSAK